MRYRSKLGSDFATRYGIGSRRSPKGQCRSLVFTSNSGPHWPTVFLTLLCLRSQTSSLSSWVFFTPHPISQVGLHVPLDSLREFSCCFLVVRSEISRRLVRDQQPNSLRPMQPRARRNGIARAPNGSFRTLDAPPSQVGKTWIALATFDVSSKNARRNLARPQTSEVTAGRWTKPSLPRMQSSHWPEMRSAKAPTVTASLGKRIVMANDDALTPNLRSTCGPHDSC